MAPSLGQSLEAWRRYVSSGSIVADLLRPPVCRAWERSHDAGARPQQFEAQSLGLSDTGRLLRQEEELITAARPFMHALSQAAGRERHAAMLGNDEAVVLDVLGDEQTVGGPEPFPGPGSLLSEGVSGSNGIGTPLAEGGYAQLVGTEHFMGGFHRFTCQGIPLRDAGRTVGVLSTSVRRIAASHRLHDILVCAAHGIEAELLHHRLQRSLQRVLEAQPGDAGVLEKLRQDVIQSHAAARLSVQAAARFMKSDEHPSAQRVLQKAGELLVEFRSQASLWQELASGEPGSSQPLALAGLVRGLVELLRTEINTRRVELVMHGVEPVTVLASRHQVLRELLHGLLSALSAAGPGGAVLVQVRQTPAQGQVCFIVHPAAGMGGASPGVLPLAFPRAEAGSPP